MVASKAAQTADIRLLPPRRPQANTTNWSTCCRWFGASSRAEAVWWTN